MSISAQAILPLAFRHKTLGAAIFIAAIMYLGKLRGDVKMRRLAMAAYPGVLRQFRSELIPPSNSKAMRSSEYHSLIATALSLLLFEVSCSGR
jgi:hypothetical protein